MEKSRAKVNAILIADLPDSFVSRRIPEAHLEFGGIVGDRHFGFTRPADSRQPMFPKGTEIFNRRQITIVSKEDCEKIAAEMGVEQIQPEWLGANLFLSGFPNLTKLTMGSRILFPGGASLMCMGENLPCTFPGEEIQKHYPHHDKLALRFVKAGYQRRGIVCLVEKTGVIYDGDEVQILINDFQNPMQ